MNALYDLLLYLIPWFIVFGFVILFFLLTFWIKKGKRSAIALGFALQVFLPNPNVERRIDVLVKQEQIDENKKNSNKN